MLIKGILVKLTESHPHNRILALFKINFYQKKKKKVMKWGKCLQNVIEQIWRLSSTMYDMIPIL